MPLLQRGVEQFRPASALRGGFHDGQAQRRHPHALELDDVAAVQVAATDPCSLMAAAVAVARHRDLDDGGREPRQTVPRGGRQTAGGGLGPVPPHPRADAGRVRERTVIDEVHAPAAAAPLAGLHAALHAASTQPRGPRLLVGDDSVLAPQIVAEHVRCDAPQPPTVPPTANGGTSART